MAGDGSALSTASPPPSHHSLARLRPQRPHEKAQAKPPPLSSPLLSSPLCGSQRRRMPSRAMSRLSVESASGSSGGCREAEPVLCAPRPRRAQLVHPCGADLILGPPPFLLNESSSEDEEGRCWAAFGGGSPPARAGNPLVHDPNFLLGQRHPAADPPLELGFFDHLSRTSYVHRPTTYTSSGSSKSSFGPSSFAPAVRIQGFDVAACRSSHSSSSNGGGRVLSARA